MCHCLGVMKGADGLAVSPGVVAARLAVRRWGWREGAPQGGERRAEGAGLQGQMGASGLWVQLGWEAVAWGDEWVSGASLSHGRVSPGSPVSLSETQFPHLHNRSNIIYITAHCPILVLTKGCGT